MSKQDEVNLYLLLLESEIEALRSVLSEFDRDDKHEYLQMIKADSIRQLLNSLVRP